MKRFLILSLVFIFLTSAAHSQTFLIDTWVDAPLEELEIDERIGVVSLETGIMDTLFDSGNIFFNIYSSPGEDGRAPELSDSLSHADDIGAHFLLVVMPEGPGVSWELYSAEEKSVVAEGFEDIRGLDDKMPDLERWTVLGEQAAENMMSYTR